MAVTGDGGAPLQPAAKVHRISSPHRPGGRFDSAAPRVHRPRWNEGAEVKAGIAKLTPTATLAAVLTIGALALAGCGSGEPTATPTASTGSATVNPGAHNAADTQFMLQLAQLSQQAIAVSQAVEARVPDGQTNPSVSEAIRLNDERLTLARNLILTWGVAGTKAPDAPGLLTDQQFDEVLVAPEAELPARVSAAGAQLLDGLVTIAEVEVRDGQNPTARRLAEALLADRKAPVPSA